MPSTPYARLLASVGGGAPMSGGITDAAVGDEVQLSIENPTGATHYRWEIYDYPPDFECPDGWSEASDGTYFSTDAVPAEFELTVWGKYLFALYINNATKTSTVERYRDIYSTAISVASPSGLLDISALERQQFNLRGWPEDQKATLRAIEAAGGGGGGGTIAGTATSSRVCFGTGSNTIGSSAQLTTATNGTNGRSVTIGGTGVTGSDIAKWIAQGDNAQFIASKADGTPVATLAWSNSLGFAYLAPIGSETLKLAASELTWTGTLSITGATGVGIQATSGQAYLAANHSSVGFGVTLSSGAVDLSTSGHGHFIIPADLATGFTWASADGSDGYFLKTNGSGVLSFVAIDASSVTFNNAASGLAAEDTQAAIDEVMSDWITPHDESIQSLNETTFWRVVTDKTTNHTITLADWGVADPAHSEALYRLNGNLTLTLPNDASQANRTVIGVFVYPGNAVTIARNGSNINGAAADLSIASSTSHQVVWLVFDADVNSWVYWVPPYAAGLFDGAALKAGSVALTALVSGANQGETLVWSGSAWTLKGLKSASLTDADATVTWASGSRFVSTVALTGNRTTTAGTSGSPPHKGILVFEIYNSANSNTRAIANGGTSGGTLYTVAAGVNVAVTIQWSSTTSDWALAGVTQLI